MRVMGEWKPNLSSGFDITTLEISPEEGFLLSRIDGMTSESQLSQMTGMSEDAVREALGRFVAGGAVTGDGAPPVVRDVWEKKARAVYNIPEESAGELVSVLDEAGAEQKVSARLMESSLVEETPPTLDDEAYQTQPELSPPTFIATTFDERLAAPVESAEAVVPKCRESRVTSWRDEDLEVLWESHYDISVPDDALKRSVLTDSREASTVEAVDANGLSQGPVSSSDSLGSQVEVPLESQSAEESHDGAAPEPHAVAAPKVWEQNGVEIIWESQELHSSTSASLASQAEASELVDANSSELSTEDAVQAIRREGGPPAWMKSYLDKENDKADDNGSDFAGLDDLDFADADESDFSSLNESMDEVDAPDESSSDASISCELTSAFEAVTEQKVDGAATVEASREDDGFDISRSTGLSWTQVLDSPESLMIEEDPGTTEETISFEELVALEDMESREFATVDQAEEDDFLSGDDIDEPIPSSRHKKKQGSTPRNFRKYFQEELREKPLDARVQLARQADAEELHAFCYDPHPRVIQSVLENVDLGLTHARLIAAHHRNAEGLRFLAKRARLLRDKQVQRGLFRNDQTPLPMVERIVQRKPLMEVYHYSISRDLTERVKRHVRQLFRRHFQRANAEEKASLILRCEGRCLMLLVGIPFDARTTATLSSRPLHSTLLLRNLARYPSTPPTLLTHMYKQPAARRINDLRNAILRHPNAPSTLKRALHSSAT